MKGQYEGQRTRDQNREVINKENRDRVLGYLNSFLKLGLSEWEKHGEKGLSRPTFNASRQTTNMFQGLVNYLLGKKYFSYVIPRNIQSDPIEGRFGWLRQLNGGDYFNSILQDVRHERNIQCSSGTRRSSS